MRVRIVTACLAVMSAAASSATSQTIRDALPATVLPVARSIADTAMTYAVYLPSGYVRDAGPHPVAFLMDPRGRALLPLERMRADAERYGWILISSYNTLSDSTTDVNVRAMNAMLTDVQKHAGVHVQRMYLVGFSGTARLAWTFAAQLHGAVTGILGVGASGLSAVGSARPHAGVSRVAFFGAVGNTDFNYEEMRAFESWLEKSHAPYRLRVFMGGHSWPPDTVFAAALDWFEAHAVRLEALDTGPERTPGRSHLLAMAVTRDTTEASRLERGGSASAALERWREVARDSFDLHMVGLAEDRIRRLEVTSDVREAERQKLQLREAFIAFGRDLSRWLDLLASSRHPQDAPRGVVVLKVDQRIERARGSNLQRAEAAQRELEHAFVQLSYYQPRRFLRSAQPEHALAVLAVAERIRPTAGVALHRAYAYIQLDRWNDALGQLRIALARGLAPAALTRDPSLRPLADDPRFIHLIRK